MPTKSTAVAFMVNRMYNWSISMFTKAVVFKQSENASTEPTEEECQQVIQLLNSDRYHERIALTEEDCKNIQFADDHCHATSRKIADANKDRGWERVSGYLFLRKYIDEFQKMKLTYTGDGLMLLKHHSVVKNEQDNLVETMEHIYPLKKYVFICHPSGSRGWDLQVI